MLAAHTYRLRSSAVRSALPSAKRRVGCVLLSRVLLCLLGHSFKVPPQPTAGEVEPGILVPRQPDRLYQPTPILLSNARPLGPEGYFNELQRVTGGRYMSPVEIRTL